MRELMFLLLQVKERIDREKKRRKKKDVFDVSLMILYIYASKKVL